MTDEEMIAKFIARRGVTKCAPGQSATDAEPEQQKWFRLKLRKRSKRSYIVASAAARKRR